MLQSLSVVYGQPASVSLDRQAVAIGREKAPALSTLVVRDPEISRRHATITFDTVEGAWWLLDAGSKNGTRVDGARVCHIRLDHGTVIRIGKTVILYSEREALKAMTDQIATLAPCNDPVLIAGEPGTRKHRIAQKIHTSSRVTGPMVNLRVSSASSAEMAVALDAAHGGTLFIGDVTMVAPSHQTALVRAMDAGLVRVVATTRHELATGTESELIRRLRATTLRVPPLRERREDILPIASAVLARFTGSSYLSADAAEAMLLYRWPHNERELEQCISSALSRRRDSGLILRRDLRCGGALVSASISQPY